MNCNSKDGSTHSISSRFISSQVLQVIVYWGGVVVGLDADGGVMQWRAALQVLLLHQFGVPSRQLDRQFCGGRSEGESGQGYVNQSVRDRVTSREFYATNIAL